MVICRESGANLHTAQLMPLPLTVSCSSKIQIGFTFLVPAHPGSPGQRAVKRVCVSGYVSTSDSDSHSDAAGIFFRHDEQRSDCVRPRSAGDQHAVQPVRLRVDERRPGVATWDLPFDVISTCSGCWHPPPHRRVKHRRPPTSQGLLSHSGRTSVSDWRTFPVLRSTCS